MSRPLITGLSLAATWLSGSAWRRADSGVDRLLDVTLYEALARRAEHAGLDFVFRPDTLWLDPQTQATGPGTSALDPTLLLACVARATQRIGVVTTMSTSFQEPFHIARTLASLQTLSQGRAAWNLVTGLDGQGNFGHRPFPAADARYRQAEECLKVVQALLGSYPASALRLDREVGHYADVASIRPIDHRGHAFQVQGPLTLPAGRPLPLFQAGASDTGRDFAARHANAVFAATPIMDAARELRAELRDRAVKSGRAADAVHVLPGLSLYLAKERSEARALHAQAHAHLGPAQRMARLAGILGAPVDGLPSDRPLTPEDLPAATGPVRSRTHAELLRRRVAREQPTLSALLELPEVVASAHWQVVGTPDDAVQEVLAWQAAGAIDGFIALPGGSLSSLGLLLDQVVPALRAAGAIFPAHAVPAFADRIGGE